MVDEDAEVEKRLLMLLLGEVSAIAPFLVPSAFVASGSSVFRLFLVLRLAIFFCLVEVFVGVDDQLVSVLFWTYSQPIPINDIKHAARNLE